MKEYKIFNQGNVILKEAFFMKISLILFLSLLFIPSPCFSVSKEELNERLSPEKILEYSLKSLQKSAEEIKEKNYSYEFQIRQLEKKIEFLRRKMQLVGESEERYSKGKKQLYDFLDVDKKEVSYARIDSLQLDREFNDVAETQESFQEKLQKREADGNRIKDQIENLEEEIDQLNGRIKALSDFLGDKDHEKERKKLVRRIEASAKRVRNAERNLGQSRKRYAKPLKYIDSLKEKYDYLKRQVTSLEDEIKKEMETEKALKDEIENFDDTKKEKMKKYDEDIVKLKGRRKELLNILEEIRKKLRDSEIDVDSYEKEIRQLKDNLSVIKKENVSLKEALSALMKSP